MQNFEEYRKDFLEDVLATEENESNGTVASFVKLCSQKLFEADVMPEYTPCYYQGTGYHNAAIRVDGYSYDDRDHKLYILSALYSGSQESEKLLGSEAHIALNRCRMFAENAIEHDLSSKIEISTEAYDLACLIKDQAKYITRFVIILLTDMSLSERANLTETKSTRKKGAKRSNRTAVLGANPICNIEVEFRIWDMPRFYRIFSAGEGHEEIAIDFQEYLQGGVPCLSAEYSSNSSNCRSYLCILPGNVLADIYDEYGSRILEGNVRSFLGKRGVNKEIRNTILNEPDMFFVYNNGLSATATEVTVKDGKLLFARDLQIVNGGQTTATLSDTRHKNTADLSKISVLMKLTQVPPDTATTIVPIIAKSANSQNKINAADFFSTHEYHIRLEQISRRKFAPAKDGAQYETHWFYERARGQYIQASMHMTKAQEKKFKIQNPKDQVITKTDLAKVLNAWNEYPYIVSKGAEANFSDFAKKIDAEWSKQRDNFNDNYFQEAIALVILYRSLDKLIPKQPWYEGGYKANIVAYTTALLRHLISKWYPDQVLDLQKIWQSQKCPDILLKQLTILAEKVYAAITSDLRPVENVTQWCKQPGCWDTVKQISCEPIDGFEKLLQDKEALANIKQDARKTRKLDNEIDTMKFILELGELYWQQMDIWLKTHSIATSAELRALSNAKKMSQGYFPDEKQSKNLMKLRAKAIAEGFPTK